MNIMKLAHRIRRELKLEGDYRCQMSFSMKKAWAIKRGGITLESILGIEDAKEIITPVSIITLEDIIKQNSNNNFVVIAKETGYEFIKAGTTKFIDSRFTSEVANTNSLLSAYSGDAAGITKKNRAKQPIPAKTVFIIGAKDEDRFKSIAPKQDSNYKYVVCDCL